MGKLHASNGKLFWKWLHWLCMLALKWRTDLSLHVQCQSTKLSEAKLHASEQFLCYVRTWVSPPPPHPSLQLSPFHSTSSSSPFLPLPLLPSLLSLLPSLPCNRHYMCTRGVYLPHIRRLRATALQVRQWGWLSRWLRRGQLQWVWCIHMYIHTIYVHCWCPEVLYISAFEHSTVGDLWSSFWNPLAQGFDCCPKWFVSWLLPSSAGEAIQVMPPSWTHFRRGACQWWSLCDTATCLQQLTLDQ